MGLLDFLSARFPYHPRDGWAERLGECVGRDRDRVGAHHREALAVRGGLGKGGQKVGVAFDGYDGAGRGAQRGSQRADARTDFEHRLVAGERSEFDDAAHDVIVDEEVLTERLLGGEAVAFEDGQRGRGCGERRRCHDQSRITMVTMRRPQRIASPFVS